MESFIIRVRPPRGIAATKRDALSQLLVGLAQRFGLQGMLDWAVELGPDEKLLGVESEFYDLSDRRSNDDSLVLYFAKEKRAADFARLLRASLPELKISGPVPAPKVDWVKRWKRFYKPVAIQANSHTPQLWILPEWKSRSRRKGELQLKIRPGQAFGTGTHPTTQLCLELFLGVSFRDLPRSSLKVLDFGAGTGILAIGALLWAKENKRSLRAVCTEIDKAAHPLLRENLRLNRVSAAVGTKAKGAGYDLVFANVLAPVLLAEQKQLWSRVRPGGVLILSGLLARESLAFMRDFLPGQKFRQRGLKQSGDWAAVLLQKPIS